MPAPSFKPTRPTARELELRKTLAENVRGLRKSRQLSQEALADKSGLHRTYVGSVERRERNVSLSTLAVLGHALGVTPAALLSRRGRPSA